MKNVRLRIEKSLEGGPRVSSSAPAVFGTLYAIDPLTGGRVQGTPARRPLIPISSDPATVCSLEIPPGQYVVEVSLPSGECLSAVIEAQRDKACDVVLQGEASPREWLAWHHLIGNVVAPQQPSLEHALNAPVRHMGRPKPAGPGRHGRFKPRVYQRWWAQLEAGTAWALLAHPKFDKRLGIKLDHEVPCAQADAEHAVYEFTGSIKSGRHRMFAIVELADTLELVTLPLPWLHHGSRAKHVIELALQRPSSGRPFASAIAVRDPNLSMLLGFLASGALPAARELATKSEERLDQDITNPLGAAAGAYAFVANTRGATQRPWRRWILNLNRQFAWLPDAAILVAALELRNEPSETNLASVRDVSLEAYSRGLPYFTLGLRWLLDIFDKLVPVFPELAQQQQTVERVALRCHPSSAFTILRLPSAGA